MRAILLASTLILFGCDAGDTTGVMRACLGADDMPRSQADDRAGFDLDVAALLADELNLELEIVWLTPTTPTQIESTDIDFRAVYSGRCDVQLSIPGPDAIAAFAPMLVLSEPYYGTAFELIPESAPTRWAELETLKLAVRANTVAHLVIDARGIEWTMRGDNESVVAAVRQGDAAAALIWGPDLALLDQGRNLTFEPPPALRWNQHIVTRTQAAALRMAIDDLLRDRSVQSKIRRLQRKHGIPDRSPFESTHQAADL